MNAPPSFNFPLYHACQTEARMEIGFEIILAILLCVIGVKVQRIHENVKTLLRDRK